MPTPKIDYPAEETAEGQEEQFGPEEGSDTATGADQFLRNQNQEPQEEPQEKKKDEGSGSSINDAQNARDAVNDAKGLADKFGGGAKAAGKGAEAVGQGASEAGAGGSAAGAAGGTAAGGAAVGTAAGAGTGAAAGTATGVGAGAAAGGTAGLLGGPAAPITVPAAALAGAVAVPLAKKFAPKPVREVGKKAAQGTKYFIAGCCSCLVALLLVPFFVIFILFIAITGGASQATANASGGSLICSSIEPTLNDSHVTLINANMQYYKAAEILTGVPWEMLAAIHFKETGNDPTHPNPYQITGWGGGTFSDATLAAANILQQKALIPPWAGAATSLPTGWEDPSGPLSADMNWKEKLMQQRIKNAFWGYNGRADYMRDMAVEYGFDRIMEGYEGSAYVMNNWDEARNPMQLILRDLNGDGVINDQDREDHIPDGAWKVFVLLKAADYSLAGQIAQLNTACISDGSVPFGCPVSGNISSGFGLRDFNPADGDFNDPGENHRGIDIVGPDGGDVKATISGRVTAVAPWDGADLRGNYVEITNDTDPNNIYKIIFMHLTSEFLVTEGQDITIGTSIGKQDNTGLSTASHTHYQIELNGVPVDPALPEYSMGLSGTGLSVEGQTCTQI